MWRIGQNQQPLVPSLLDQFELSAQLLDPLRSLAIRPLEFGRIETLPLRPCHLFTGGILIALQALQFWQEGTTTRFKCPQLLNFGRQIDASPTHRVEQGSKIFPQ